MPTKARYPDCFRCESTGPRLAALGGGASGIALAARSHPRRSRTSAYMANSERGFAPLRKRIHPGVFMKNGKSFQIVQISRGSETGAEPPFGTRHKRCVRSAARVRHHKAEQRLTRRHRAKRGHRPLGPPFFPCKNMAFPRGALTSRKERHAGKVAKKKDRTEVQPFRLYSAKNLSSSHRIPPRGLVP